MQGVLGCSRDEMLAVYGRMQCVRMHPGDLAGAGLANGII